MAFIRQQMLAGDPITGGALSSRRKSAGAGIKAKAARHRAIRFSRMARMGDPFGGMTQAGKAGLAAANKGKGFDFASMQSAFGNLLKGAAPIAKGVLSSGFLGPAGALAGSLIPSTISSGAMASLQRRGAAPSGFGPMIAPPPSLASLGITGGGGGGGGKRRTMNVLNVKALRRGARRLEGFQNQVKKIEKLLPARARVGGSHPAPKRKRR